MIKEAYCSFEVSKLLKEKGFIESCYGRYSIRSKEFHFDCTKAYNNGSNFMYSAPTHQMAMAWLREVYYLWIDIDLLTNYKWTWSIWFMNDPKLKIGESSQVISTYEEAVEAALKYCLENLIKT